MASESTPVYRFLPFLLLMRDCETWKGECNKTSPPRVTRGHGGSSQHWTLTMTLSETKSKTPQVGEVGRTWSPKGPSLSVSPFLGLQVYVTTSSFSI